MDHGSSHGEKMSEQPQEQPHHREQTPFKKSKFYLWLTSSSELIGIFIAVAIVVTGSIIVFGNNASQKNSKHKQVAQKQQTKKEKMSVKNVTSQLSANTKKIKKRVARANRNLKANRLTSSTRDASPLGASVAVGTSTPESVRLQADRRITELWQAQNAVEANDGMSQSLRSQIVRKITGKIGKVDSIKKSIPANGTPTQLTDAFKKIQDQKVYSCYLPNITKQAVNEDVSSLAREQTSVTKELRSVANDFKKQGKKTEQLTQLISDRNQRVRQITDSVQSIRQEGIQAENSNCATPTPSSIAPVTKQFDDLTTLDDRIRQTVDQMLKEKGVGSNPATTVAPNTNKKTAKKLAREIEKKAKGKKGKDVRPTKSATQPTVAEEAPAPTATEEVPVPTESQESENPEVTPEATPGEEPPAGEPLEKPDFAAFGLPSPQVDAANDLKAQIEDDEKAAWAVTALLKGEKTAIDKGMDVIPYLTTGWIWFESGLASWPDPYAVNCNDNRAGYYSEVSVICKADNFQIGGYQAAAQKSQYVSLFTKFYKPEELADVVERVASDSTNAIRPQWNYNDKGQQKGVLKQYITQLDSVKVGDISPNVDFFSEKGQFFTLLVGKDPNMVIALNSFAVSEDDLVAALKAKTCTYDYICAPEKQKLSNIVAALYLLDGGTL